MAANAADSVFNRPLREVRLYGWLGRKYGRSFRLAARTPADAVRLLAANFKDFVSDFIGPDGSKRYHVRVGKHAITTETECCMQGAAPIRIVPIVEGAKAGVLQTIVGVVLIAAGIALQFAPGIGPEVGTYLIKAGIALTIGGVIQMLTPVPKADSTRDQQSGSSYFDGPVNLTAAGNPVPVLIGRAYTGSVVISGAIAVDQLMPDPAADTAAGQLYIDLFGDIP